jgi:hypothetical protein
VLTHFSQRYPSIPTTTSRAATTDPSHGACSSGGGAPPPDEAAAAAYGEPLTNGATASGGAEATGQGLVRGSGGAAGGGSGAADGGRGEACEGKGREEGQAGRALFAFDGLCLPLQPRALKAIFAVSSAINTRLAPGASSGGSSQAHAEGDAASGV